MYSSTKFQTVAVTTALCTFVLFCGCTQDNSSPRPALSPPAQPSSNNTTTNEPVEPSPSRPSDPASVTENPATKKPVEGGWGNLKIRFVYDGTAPAPAPLNVSKDIAYCGKHKLTDESLVVGADGGVANVVVLLYSKPTAIHPSYEESATATIKLDNKNCRFEPHVCVVRVGQTLQILNSDTVGHNTKVDLFNNPPFNQLIPDGTSMSKQFTKAERLPATVGCNIHPWMQARLVVQDHPYVAVSNKQGVVEITNLPTGELTFMAWQEKSGYVSQVSLDGKATSWRRGRFKFTIAPGENDMGQVKLGSDLFK